VPHHAHLLELLYDYYILWEPGSKIGIASLESVQQMLFVSYAA